MKIKHLFLSLLVFISNTLTAQNQFKESSDSLSANIDRSITRYLASVPVHPDSLIRASDKLIEAGSKNNLSSHIASRLFSIFKNIDIMGLESVALHIAQNYFLNGKLNPPEGIDIIDLKLYSDFNKHSLIGMQAPEIKLKDFNGNDISLRNKLGYRYTILLFFDDNCSLCRLELPKIKSLSDSLETDGVKVITVYTQPDTSKLRNYIFKEFNTIPANWIIASDPSYSSDFQRLYNVIKTPQVFLIDKTGKIIGRNLNSASLKDLITRLNETEKEFENQAKRFAAAYMEAVNYEDSISIKESYGQLFTRLSSLEDKSIYRTMFSYIFEELLYSDNELRRQASVIVAKSYIMPFLSFWDGPDYPGVWVPSMVNRTIANRIGEKFKMSYLLNSKGRRVKLGKSCTKYTLIYYTDPECASCKLYTARIKSEYANLRKSGIRVTAVYPMGNPDTSKRYKEENSIEWDILSPGPNGYNSVFSIYEAEKVPSSVLLDKRGKIIAKNIDFATIKDIIK
ncbi:MAG: redoxin domain-containing protein [Bacteroidales bacterium]|jgi:peroxiredoxin|nr:redoxin domain-containing protein [Bacteroidales bacterium]